ncbi:MAG: right-handed parallel beta-helix repeat-containing protein [Chitinophagaceae bacterium]|nr:right-handed parallel beta-helix repeat-containing protein [Chitinophagaceae bacterium]
MKTKFYLLCQFLVIGLFFLFSSPAFSEHPDYSGPGSTYYVDAVSGLDANDGLSPASAWKTLGKINNTNFQPGDNILFRRGQTFSGFLKINISDLTFSAFGTGNKPVISGFSDLSIWTDLGNGIYETAGFQPGNSLNMVLINGAVKAMGRHPNSNAGNGGYLTVQSHIGTTSISDASMSGFPDWTGAEVVIRKVNWVLDRCRITNHSNQTITYSSPTGHQPIDGHGYFIQNHPSTLDQFGEWYYDKSTNKLKVFFGSDPSAYSIRAAVVDTVITIGSAATGTLIDNLLIEGADTAAIYIAGAKQVQIKDCDIRFSGTEAIWGVNADLISIENCFINHTNNNGIRLYDCPGSIVRNNIIKNTGLIAGMGLSNNQQYEAIYVNGSKSIIERNVVDSVGYSGITFAGDSVLIQNNFVNHYTLTLDDGGGIYGWGEFTKYGRKITGNIILNGIGAPLGTTTATPVSSAGIYLDDWSANVEITDNSIANASQTGIYIHNSHAVQIKRNTLFNNSAALSMINNGASSFDYIRGMDVKDNIFFSRISSQPAIMAISLYNDLNSFGVFDNNYYARPLDTSGLIFTSFRDQNNGNNYSNAGLHRGAWTHKYNFDAHPFPSQSIKAYTIANEGANIAINSSCDNVNNLYCVSVPGGSGAVSVNDGHLDGNAVRVSVPATNYAVNTNISLGNVEANKNYIIRFSLQGLVGENTLGCFIIRNANPYNTLTPNIQYFPLKTTRTENEFLFHAPGNDPVLLVFQATYAESAYYIDNLELREATVSVTNPDDSILFVYNETATVKTITLNATYKDVKEQVYYPSISLQPFSSAVLIKVNYNILPVKALRLAGKRNGEMNNLKWTVSGELKNRSFVIERSEDGQQFVAFHKLKAIDQQPEYSYSDIETSGKRLYYRVKEIDETGSFVFSNTVKFGINNTPEIEYYPNPATSQLNVNYQSLEKGTIYLRILSMDGKVMQEKRVKKDGGILNTSMNMDRLIPGVYLIELRMNDELKQSRKIIRQ